MQPSFPSGLSVRIWPSQAAKLHHCAQWVQSKPHSDDLSLKSQTRAPHRSAEASPGFTSGAWRSWSAFRQWVITAGSAAQQHLCSLFQMENCRSRLLWNNPPYFRYCSHPPTLISPLYREHLSQSLVISGPRSCNHRGSFIFLAYKYNITLLMKICWDQTVTQHFVLCSGIHSFTFFIVFSGFKLACSRAAHVQRFNGFISVSAT